MQYKFVVTRNATKTVFDAVDEIKEVNFKAVVDGDEYLYQLKCKQSLFDGGANLIYWHAKNSGEKVKFVLP